MHQNPTQTARYFQEETGTRFTAKNTLRLVSDQISTYLKLEQQFKLMEQKLSWAQSVIMGEKKVISPKQKKVYVLPLEYLKF